MLICVVITKLLKEMWLFLVWCHNLSECPKSPSGKHSWVPSSRGGEECLWCHIEKTETRIVYKSSSSNIEITELIEKMTQELVRWGLSLEDARKKAVEELKNFEIKFKVEKTVMPLPVRLLWAPNENDFWFEGFLTPDEFFELRRRYPTLPKFKRAKITFMRRMAEAIVPPYDKEFFATSDLARKALENTIWKVKFYLKEYERTPDTIPIIETVKKRLRELENILREVG